MIENVSVCGMTVAELIEALREFPAEAQVVFAYDYGDHGHTKVAVGVANVDSSYLVPTAYAGAALPRPDPDDDEHEDDPDYDDGGDRESFVVITG